MSVSQCLQMLGMLDDNAGLLLNDFGFGNYLRERNLTGKVVTENFEQRCCVKNIKLLLTVWLLAWSSQVWSDNFFDLGGYSLLLIKVRNLLSKQGYYPDLMDLFRYPTIASLSTFLKSIVPLPDR